ncbi:MAG: putative sulfate exporter family transporter [Dehalococcoidales bacterium]|nr:putative sulfate exporter family transporter [Dehalococcoidales bacterium]
MNDNGGNEEKIRKPSIIENLLFGCTIREVPRLIPGVLFAITLVVLFIWLTNFLNAALGFSGLISYILVVIIAGIVVRNIFSIPTFFGSGIDFCLKKLLRLGIILMGIRLSIFNILEIGVWGIPIVVVCVVSGLVLTIYVSRLMKLPDKLATLIAVGTSICGASAILAIAPGINAKDEEVTYAVANITVFGIIAMIVYPFLSHWLFNGDTILSGLFTGTSIHETAQVAASSLIYDQTFLITSEPTVADVAMVTKLVRNVLMAVVIPLMIFVYARRTGDVGSSSEPIYKKTIKLFPLFILGFMVMAIIRSIGDAGIHNNNLAIGLWNNNQWAGVISGIKEWSGYIMATAMAGVGLGTSFKSMKRLGIKPFYAGFFTAALVGVVAIIMVFALGRFVLI